MFLRCVQCKKAIYSLDLDWEIPCFYDTKKNSQVIYVLDKKYYYFGIVIFICYSEMNLKQNEDYDVFFFLDAPLSTGGKV